MTEQEKEELEGIEDGIRDFLIEECFIEGDDEDWEPVITQTAKKLIAFYNREQ